MPFSIIFAIFLPVSHFFLFIRLTFSKHYPFPMLSFHQSLCPCFNNNNIFPVLSLFPFPCKSTVVFCFLRRLPDFFFISRVFFSTLRILFDSDSPLVFLPSPSDLFPPHANPNSSLRSKSSVSPFHDCSL